MLSFRPPQMKLIQPPQMTVARMLVGALDIVAVPLLRGETPDGIQDTAQFYGFSDYGQGESRYFEYSGRLNELPSLDDRIVVLAPKGRACRIELHHAAAEARDIPGVADAWRKMVARSPDPAWVLEIRPGRQLGPRLITAALVTRTSP